MTDAPTGPLVGIRILDLGTMLAGPFAATLLADFGAEVIKVELPGIGDGLRRLGPVNEAGHSYWFAADARNKKSITLDLRTPEGRDILLALAERADVLVENFIPGTLARWGLGAEALQARNPGLIISRASGFGQDGPNSHLPGYDRIGAAFGGLWHIGGDPDGPPMRPGISLVDYMTGMYGALGIMLALYHRDARGGAGQEIDAALYESVLRAMEFTITQYSAEGVVRERVGNSGPASPTGAWRASDGAWVAVSVAQDAMYVRAMRVIGRHDLAEDSRYADMRGRLADREPVETALEQWIAGRPVAEVVAAFEAAQVAVGEIRSIDRVVADPHVQARGIITSVDDPLVGAVAVQGVTPRLSVTPGAVRRPAPVLGEHNDEVYGVLLGMGESKLAELRARGVI